jgi:hypothetical protein
MHQWRPQMWCIASFNVAAVRVAALRGDTPAVQLRLGFGEYAMQMIVTCGITALHRSSPALQLRTPI